MKKLTNAERELVALGAAIASNCVPCIEYHIPEARKAGLDDQQIRGFSWRTRSVGFQLRRFSLRPRACWVTLAGKIRSALTAPASARRHLGRPCCG
jgi:4-carboxymuconolactone decarboxylase